MPGFTIDTRAAGSDENGTPHVELYYSPERLQSKIQEKVVATLDQYDKEIYDVSEDSAVQREREVATVPTTLAIDADYEIQRWEGLTHADDIRKVLDQW
jgi:hypothetical protein